MAWTGIIIVAIVFISIMFKRYLDHQLKVKALESEHQSRALIEMKQDIKTLKARIEVLEKIVTDSGYQLNNEINRL
ncbi:hypothetical protein [Photobacterium sp. TY1-4]|uniref:hypothetical protein n=1 Tax=Photobacterium sp. TY1-4 TaxID=2899122 RepID=UPI0021BFD6EA|nr:hypothetical protein [Photobacterium sp. TY1-4]UXI03204.1 hypothetical protein NH461_22460 [Photobacterium sp. TY1-4]